MRNQQEKDGLEMEYKVDDRGLDAAIFLPFVNRIWPGEYDRERTQSALSKTMNITAYDGETLVGCLRILSDGCYFGTITELLPAGLSEARDRQQAPAACPGKRPDNAVFRRAAGAGSVL